MKGYFTKRTIDPTSRSGSGEGLKHPNAIGRELRGPSLWIDSTLFPEDDRGEIYVPMGLILAKVLIADDENATNADDTTYGPTYKYVPYNAYAAYGVGSDTAVGILDRLLNLNYENDDMVSPVIHSQIIEAAAYIYGGAKGDGIPQAVKDQLSGIFWV